MIGPPPLSRFHQHSLDRLPAGAYVCDPDGLITWFNDRAVEIWGRKPKMGDPVDRFCGSFKLYDYEGEPIPHDRCWMALALRDARSYEGREILIEQPSGARVPVLAYANPVHDEQGSLIGAINVLVDVTEARAAQQDLRRKERELEDFFENGPVALHWVAGDGTIIRANQAELDLLGYSREEYVGRHIAEFHADEDVIQDILTRLTAGETLRDCEARLVTKDGAIREVSISSSGYFEDGELIRTRCFTLDIGDRKRAERQLLDADRRKDEFLAMLAHELRNPLVPIVFGVESLRLGGRRDPDVERAMAMIERQALHLARLVDDLTDVARITRGKPSVSLERVDLSDVVESALEGARPLIDRKGHRLDVVLPAAPVPMEVDPVRISQVLLNLLRNAAQYTDAGGEITLGAERLGEDGQQIIRFSIRDNGRGLAPGDIDRVFELFERAASPRAANGADGASLGVGLTLVKTLVELHGGRVEALSDGLGQGAEFRVDLPLSSAGPVAEVPPGALRRGEKAARSLRVLVVEDNAEVAEGMQWLLEHEGHMVAVGRSGREALDLAPDFDPEVALVDIGLPDTDGYDVCRRLRRLPGGGEVFIVAVTGWGRPEDKAAAAEAGFDLHVTKPLTGDDLQAVFRSHRAASGT